MEVNNQDLYNTQQENEESSSLSFGMIYKMVVLNWKWFVLSLALCLGVAYAYLRYKTPVYQSAAKLLIKDDDNTNKSNGVNALLNSQTLGLVSNSTGIDNEMVLLKSSRLAGQTIYDLKLYVSYKMKGRVADHLLYKNQPITVDIDSSSLSNLKAPIKLEITREEGSFHITGEYTYVPSDPDKLPSEYTIDRTVKDLPFTLNTSVGRLTFSHNGVSMLPEEKKLKVTILPIQMAAAKYVAALDVAEENKKATIVDMTLADEVPERSCDYLKQLAVCYNRQANEDKNEIAIRTERFINSRLEKINNELGQTEGNLESTKRQYGIVNTTANSTMSLTNSDAYAKQISELNTQMELLKSISEFMNEPANKYQLLPSNVGLADASASAFIKKYNEVALERTHLLRTSSETSPVVTPLTAQLDELLLSIRRSIKQAHQAAEIQYNDLQRQFSLYNQQILSTPQQERILTQIGRQQEVKSGLYLMLLQKREENSISLAATADKGKLIDDPQFLGKVSPKGSMIMLIALVLGLAIPAGILFLIEFFRYKIEGHDDVAALTKLPIIGDVAIASDQAKTKADIVVHANQNNLMEEVFRSIRANIQFMLKKGENTIMFTSTTSSEGKTFTAANLAVSFALLDKKVVIVGLDIRKPRLAELFEIPDHHHGITNLLVKENPTMEDIKKQILPSGVNENLDVLMAGPIPPNPSELVSRQSLDIIIGQLKEHYDYVIIDTAPIGLVTDTQQIARVADLTVYMCRADYTPKSSIAFINSLNAENKMPNMCIVINGIDMAKKKYGYYYGYGKYGKYGKYGHYGKYGNYGKSYGSYGANYGSYGNYANSGYGNRNDNSIKV